MAPWLERSDGSRTGGKWLHGRNGMVATRQSRDRSSNERMELDGWRPGPGNDGEMK